MRPAQKAPENKSLGSRWICRRSCFNEAGAKSAGKQELRIALDLPPELLQ